MAVTGRFTADFASFYDAVQKADVQLQGFDSQAGTVEKSLNRMVNSLSGTKVIAQAQLMAEAVERIGGVSKLTEAELARFGAVAQEAGDKFRALGGDAPAKIQAIADAARSAGDASKVSSGFFGNLSQQIVATTASFVSAQAIIGAVKEVFSDLSQFVRGSVSAYADAESAQVKLVAALRQHSLATPQVIAQYNELGATFQRTTKYSDDEINAMEALLTQVGGVLPSQMAGALKASTDLASGLGIDLHSATTLVAKAAAGHTETLGRYGITVSQAAVQTRGFDAVLEAINRQFGGQAQADLDTYNGQIQNVANSWNNFQEAVGKIIIQDPIVQAALRGVRQAASELDDQSSTTTTSLAGVADALGFTTAATGLVLLEGYTDHLNEVARAAKQINDLPSPFARWEADRVLPQINAGMVLFNEEVTDAERAAKAFKASLDEINSAGLGANATLGTLDSEVVNAIKYYLEAGVSQNALAGYYAVTAAQVKAVATAVKEEIAVRTIELGILKDAGNLTGLNSDAQKRLQVEMANVEVASKAERDAQEALNREYGVVGVSAVERFQKALEALHRTKVEGISQSAQEQILIDKYTKALLDEAVAQDKANAALGEGNKVAAQVPAALGSATAAVYQFQGSLIATNAELQRFHAQFANEIGNLSKFTVGTPTGIGAGGRFIPGFAGGVQNFSGGAAIVGERGPELVNLPRGSNVIPLGGRTVNVYNTFNIVDTAENLAQRASESIMRSIKRSLLLGPS